MGFTREAVKEAREKHAQMEAKEESKKHKAELVPSKAKPKETKSAPTLVKHSTIQSSSNKGVLNKNEKTKRTYVVVSLVASDTETNEEVVKEKNIKVERKTQSVGAQHSKKDKSKSTLTERAKRGRELRTELDEDLESGNLQGKYTFVPPLTIEQLIDGN